MSFYIPDEKRFFEYVSERRIIPFIGSGFSKNVSPDFPDWSQLIDIAANKLSYDPNIIKLLGDTYQIAEYYEYENEITELIRSLTPLLDNKEKYNVSNSDPHLLLPYFDVESIYTTNWDDWIEEGFRYEGIPYQTICKIKHLINAKIEKNQNPHPKYESYADLKRIYKNCKIVKFHGDLSYPDTIIVKESDYFRRLEFEDPLDIKFRSDIIGRSVMFVGYSFTDLNIRYLWYKLSNMQKSIENSPKSYLVTSQKNPILKRILERKDIEIILLDPVNIKDSLRELFLKIIENQK